jgi:hypothetical protein
MSCRSWSPAAVAVVFGLLVAACGSGGTATPGASASGGTHNSASVGTNASASGGPDAAALRSQMVAAMKQARSVHVNGSISQGAQRTALDVVMTQAGGIGGTLSVGGHPIAVRTSRGHAYILVSRSLTKSQKLPPAACALMCGKWLKASGSELQSLTSDAGWTKIIGAFEAPMASETVSYHGKATVNGQPALMLNFVGFATVYVAAQGTPYPLRIQFGANRIAFSDWNTAKLPPPPPASKVITTGQLATGG